MQGHCAIAAAVALLCAVQPVRAQSTAAARAPQRVAAIRVSLAVERPRVTPGQIAVCANLAAVRGMEARAAGASYATQDRVLNVSFVLCMAAADGRTD